MGRLKGSVKKPFAITTAGKDFLLAYHTTGNRSLVITDTISGQCMRVVSIEERRLLGCKTDRETCMVCVRGLIRDKTPQGFRAWIESFKSVKTNRK